MMLTCTDERLIIADVTDDMDMAPLQSNVNWDRRGCHVMLDALINPSMLCMGVSGENPDCFIISGTRQ
jgi:hypothetical protein